MKKLINVRGGKFCAICRYWNDPANAAITPQGGVFWLCDSDVVNMCLKRYNYKVSAMGCCMQFENKIM